MCAHSSTTGSQWVVVAGVGVRWGVPPCAAARSLHPRVVLLPPLAQLCLAPITIVCTRPGVTSQTALQRPTAGAQDSSSSGQKHSTLGVLGLPLRPEKGPGRRARARAQIGSQVMGDFVSPFGSPSESRLAFVQSVSHVHGRTPIQTGRAGGHAQVSPDFNGHLHPVLRLRGAGVRPRRD